MKLPIEYYCFYLSSALLTVSLFGNYFAARFLGVSIFFLFGCIAGFRDLNYNNDTKNYILHFESYQNGEISEWFSAIFNGWFEPGYSLISFVFSLIMSAEAFIFVITVVPTVVFCWQFMKYKYHPAIIAHILSTIMLVSATTTVRHFIVLSVLFVIFNSFVYQKTIRTSSLGVPILIHFSSMPIVAFLAYEKSRGLLGYRFFILITTIFIFIYHVTYGSDFLQLMYEKLKDRAQEETQSTGMRNFILIALLALTVHCSGKVVIKRVHLFHIIGVIISLGIFVFDWLGLNRLTSFFLICFLVYFNFYNKSNRTAAFINMSLLNAITLASTLYFALNI